jgi:hypothetical protein
MNGEQGGILMGSIPVIRWIMVALSAALSVVLIVHGNVIVGVLIGALALSRAALLVRTRSRRREFRRRRELRAGRIARL